MTLAMLTGEQPTPADFGRSGAPPEPAETGRLRLAFVSSADPLNVRTWSGTPFHMLEALKRHSEVVEVVRKPWPAWFDIPRRALRRFSNWRYDPYWSPFWSALGSRRTVDRLAECDCDAVVAVAVTPIVAHLAERKPTVFISDATFFAMADYNWQFQRLIPGLKKSAHALEHAAIERSLIATYPSRWAESSALDYYSANEATTFQIPWGANLEAIDPSAPEDRPTQPWRLLFVGVDWDGKGGDILLDTLRILRAAGHDVELDIVGCAPSDPPPTVDGATFHGFISKHTPEGRERLAALFRRSHLFVLPTQFDAFPTVIAESAAYGLPAISYRTGGLPSNVLDGETGILLDEGAPAAAFAETIADLLSQPERYRQMAEAAQRFSREALNWDSWARNVIASISGALATRDVAAPLAD